MCINGCLASKEESIVLVVARSGLLRLIWDTVLFLLKSIEGTNIPDHAKDTRQENNRYHALTKRLSDVIGSGHFVSWLALVGLVSVFGLPCQVGPGGAAILLTCSS